MGFKKDLGKLVVTIMCTMFCCTSVSKNSNVPSLLDDTYQTSLTEEAITVPADAAYGIVVVVKKEKQIKKMPMNTIPADTQDMFFYKKGELFLKEQNKIYELKIKGIVGVLKDNFKGNTQQYTYYRTSDSLTISGFVESDTLCFKGNPFKNDFTYRIFNNDVCWTVPVSKYFDSHTNSLSQLRFEIAK